MKQTKKWLVIAAVLLCSVTRISAEITLGIDYYGESWSGIATTSTNEEGIQQGEYTSEVISCSEPFNTITLICLHNDFGAGDDYDYNDPSGYPFISLAEFYLYDGEGNEIPLTAENFSTNAQEPTEGPIENICDGDRTTFFHSMWTVAAGEHHKLMITLPEGKELKEFKFKYITRWRLRDALRQISISTDKGSVVIPKGSCGENLTYTLSHDGHLEISGTGAMSRYNSFSGIGLITKVTISEGVTSISTNPFQGCNDLTSIVVEAGNTVYDSRDNCDAIIETNTNVLIAGCSTTQIPGSVTSIGACAFSDCTNLTSITIPESVTSIDGSAFSGCSGLTSITLPGSITKIGESAFRNCSKLTALAIPAKVTEIASRAFYYCTGLTSITSYAKVPPTIDSSKNTPSFGKVDTTIPLYVPIGSEAAYQSADGWKDFSNIIGVDTGIENLESESTSSFIYDLSGRRVENGTKNGIYIVNGKKIIIK